MVANSAKRFDMTLEGHVVDVTDPKNPTPFHDISNAFRNMPEDLMVMVQQLAVGGGHIMTKIGEVKAAQGKDAAIAYAKKVIAALHAVE